MNIEDKLLIKNLASTAELINTINGGMAQPYVVLEKSEASWLLRMRIPSVNVDNIKIEVKEGILLVFHNLETSQSDIELPYLIEMLNLTGQIDLDSIYAEYDDEEIFVHLPFDEMASGFEREIEIVKR
ncbi:MAG: hypothetical protein ACJA08_001233 [Cyclobacteriaceae bacterium]|jgi:hypothetical protein